MWQRWQVILGDDVDDYADRLAALLEHPISRWSLERQHEGPQGRRIDIEVPPGWLPVVERLFRELEALPEWPIISRVEGRHAGLVIDHDGDHDSRAACLVETAIGVCEHRCQVCGARGRLQDNDLWTQRVCQTHWLDLSVPDVGEPWPPIQSLVHLRGGAVLLFGNVHGFIDQPLRPWRADSRVSLNRQLDARDAVACALDPRETARQLDASIFQGGAILRQFELVDAHPLLAQAAEDFDMASDRLESLIVEVQTGGRWHNAASALSALLRGDYDKDVG